MSDIDDEAELFELLKHGGLIDGTDKRAREIQSNRKLADTMRGLFRNEGITRFQLERGLSDSDKDSTKRLIDRAYDMADVAVEDARKAALPGVSSLGTIQDLSKHLLDSTSPRNMEARWAEEYYGGYFAKRKGQIEDALANGKTAASTGQGGYNNEGGASYYVSTLRFCYSCVTPLC